MFVFDGWCLRLEYKVAVLGLGEEIWREVLCVVYFYDVCIRGLYMNGIIYYGVYYDIDFLNDFMILKKK